MITQSIKFTATAGQDLFNNAALKGLIKTALGLNDAAYEARLSENSVTGEKMGFSMTFDLVCDSDTTVKINNGAQMNLVGGAAYSNTFYTSIWSIVLGSATTGVININF